MARKSSSLILQLQGRRPPSTWRSPCMYRTAEDPKLWYETFKKNMEGGGRASNELCTLCDSLWAAGSHDQLNLGALASVEIQCRRVAVVIEACNDPQHPSWSTALPHGKGTQADAAIAPALRSNVPRRAKGEAEILATRSRVGSRATPQWHADDQATPNGVADGVREADAGWGRGRGRGRGGRQRGPRWLTERVWGRRR